MPSVTTTRTAILRKQVQTYRTAILVHASGSYRGVMTDSAWTSLSPKKAGDTTIITDASTGKPKARYYDGTSTFDYGRGVNAGESNQPNDLFATSVVIQPKDDTSIGLVVRNTVGGTAANWSEWQINDGTLRSWVTSQGGWSTTQSVQVYGSSSDTEPKLELQSSSPGGIRLGAGGSTAPDVNIFRASANVLQTDDQLYAAGALTTKTKAGAPTDSDTTLDQDGTLVLDTTNHRLYVRSGGAWKYAALT